ELIMNFLPKFFTQADDQPAQPQDDKVARQLIRREAEIGGTLFGPVAKGHRRDFFCLDRYTWVWHEEWQQDGQHRQLTTRYEVRPDGVLKIQGNRPYQRLTKDEARNLYQATELYRQKVGGEYQRVLQAA
ncbi:MAG TPA: hypothetical protein VM535_01490, partial [Candidatus Saccharimonadales bacterium]|nr:hypothetical protein [Candidatus Saccharimonadales bacterium]